MGKWWPWSGRKTAARPFLGIDVHDRGFVVRYVEPITRPADALMPSARLQFAVEATSGAAASEQQHLGYDSCSFTAFSIDGEDTFEHTLALTPANVTALEATGFPWSPAARAAATRIGHGEQAVEVIRAAVLAAHRDQLAAFAAFEAWSEAVGRGEQVRPFGTRQ